MHAAACSRAASHQHRVRAREVDVADLRFAICLCPSKDPHPRRTPGTDVASPQGRARVHKRPLVGADMGALKLFWDLGDQDSRACIFDVL